MCVRRLIALKNLIPLLAAAVFFLPALAFALNQGDAEGIDLEGLQSHIAGDYIKWSVKDDGSRGKILVPVGMISKKCVIFNNEHAKMVLGNHPDANKTGQLVLFVKLTSACQELSSDKTHYIAKDINKADEDRIPLSKAFGTLGIDKDFTGTISLCAYNKGDPALPEERMNCSQLSLIGSKDIVENNNKIIGEASRAAVAQNSVDANDEQIRFEQAREILNTFSRQSCQQNLMAANSALRSLSTIGVTNTRELIRKNNEAAMANFEDQLKNAETRKDVDKILARFKTAEAAFNDAAAAKKFKESAIDKYIELATAEIDELESMSGTQALELQRLVDKLKKDAETVLGKKSAADKRDEIEALRQALVNKALALGEGAKAIELAKLGERKTSGNMKLTYIKAQRRIQEKDYANCVDKYQEPNKVDKILTKCSKIQNAARKTQKRMEQEAKNVLSEDDYSDLRDEGIEVVGAEFGIIKTPFGYTVQNESYGTMGMYGMDAIQEIMLQQLAGYRGLAAGGMGGLGGMSPLLLQQQLGGAGNLYGLGGGAGLGGLGAGGAGFRGQGMGTPAGLPLQF